MPSSGMTRLERAKAADKKPRKRTVFTARFDKADDYLNKNVYKKKKKKKGSS